MSEKIYLTHKHIEALTLQMIERIGESIFNPELNVYAVPRGGVAVVYLMKQFMKFNIVSHPDEADLFIDDIIDSGQTRKKYFDKYPIAQFAALITRETEESWYVFPWEVKESGEEEGIEANVVRLLQYIGEDPERQGLLETPARVSKAWQHWTGGYALKAEDIFKVFEDGAKNYDEMVVVKNIPFYSHCEHHLAPFFGKVTIGYIPDGKIVGLSKLSRLVDMFARRLQVQERLTMQISDSIQEHLNPVGIGVKIDARHLCMESRGICQQGHSTVTTAFKGALLSKPEARAEFMAL